MSSFDVNSHSFSGFIQKAVCLGKIVTLTKRERERKRVITKPKQKERPPYAGSFSSDPIYLQRQKTRFYSGFEFSVAAGNVLFLQQLHNRKCVRMKEWQRNKLLVEGKGCALMTDENRKKRCREGRGNFGCDEKNKYCCRRKAFVFLWRFGIECFFKLF